MIETLFTLLEATIIGHDTYRCLSSIKSGKQVDEHLQQLATEMTDLKLHVERLSDTLLYAVNLDGAKAVQQSNPQYINDLREVRQMLEPIQQNFQQPLLASAMIADEPPADITKQLRQKLIFLAPLKFITYPEDRRDWVPMLFQDRGEYWIGWQSPAVLSQLGYDYYANWQPNQNQLPPEQQGIGRILIENGQIQEQSNTPAETVKKRSDDKVAQASSTSKKSADKSRDSKIFRDNLQDGGEGPEMVWIPAGTFKMGDIRGTGWDNEQPVHEVAIKRLAMGRYPVTFAEYDRFAEATDRKKPNDNGWGRDNRPVINVSWTDAVAYAEWLTNQTGHQYRLPTEAEWEYAARAGTETDYWWGNDIGKNRCVCRESGSQWSGKQTAPVGSFEPNPFGLYDTVGNVWEWTCSEYEKKYNGKEQQCADKGTGSPLVLRGGAWFDLPRLVRAAYRGRSSDDSRGGYVGFRLVQSLLTL